MSVYQANRSYDPSLDVRNYSDLPNLVRSSPPDGVLWLLVAPRRGRKTWTLNALEYHLTPTVSTFVDLRYKALPTRTPTPGHCLLLDEPVEQLNTPEKARAFLAQCAKLHKQHARVVLALTPRELSLLEQADAKKIHVAPSALRRLPALSLEEAQRQARTGDAKALLARLPPTWTQSAFLLELVFETQEQKPGASDRDLLRAVVQRCEESGIRYVYHVFNDSLTGEQRALVRGIAHGTAKPKFTDCEVLIEAGLVARELGQDKYRVANPVLDMHLSPLRIHHISDIHVGPKAASTTDVKEHGPLTDAADAGLVRQSYLDHVRMLGAHGAAPHLVVVSGDIAEHAASEQYAEIRPWFSSLRAALAEHPLLGDDDPRILVVGGNHDVDWSQTLGSGPGARHGPFAEAFAEYRRPLLELPPERRPVAAARYTDLGVEILLLGSAEFGGEVEEERVRGEFLRELSRIPKKHVNEDIPDDERRRIEELAVKAARIDPGLVHNKDLEQASRHDWDSPVRIAVLHHPVSALPSTEIARYAGLVNAGAVKDVLFRSGFCLVLHGHVHSGWFARKQWPGRHEERALRIVSAPSLGSREVLEHNGFNLIEILRDRGEDDEGTHKIVVRRFVREGPMSWIERAAMGPFAPGS